MALVSFRHVTCTRSFYNLKAITIISVEEKLSMTQATHTTHPASPLDHPGNRHCSTAAVRVFQQQLITIM